MYITTMILLLLLNMMITMRAKRSFLVVLWRLLGDSTAAPRWLHDERCLTIFHKKIFSRNFFKHFLNLDMVGSLPSINQRKATCFPVNWRFYPTIAWIGERKLAVSSQMDSHKESAN